LAEISVLLEKLAGEKQVIESLREEIKEEQEAKNHTQIHSVTPLPHP
jgi:hypothetical protein